MGLMKSWVPFLTKAKRTSNPSEWVRLLAPRRALHLCVPTVQFQQVGAGEGLPGQQAFAGQMFGRLTEDALGFLQVRRIQLPCVPASDNQIE